MQDSSCRCAFMCNVMLQAVLRQMEGIIKIMQVVLKYKIKGGSGDWSFTVYKRFACTTISFPSPDWCAGRCPDGGLSKHSRCIQIAFVALQTLLAMYRLQETGKSFAELGGWKLPLPPQIMVSPICLKAASACLLYSLALAYFPTNYNQDCYVDHGPWPKSFTLV